MKRNRAAFVTLALLGAMAGTGVGQTAWANSRFYDFTVTVPTDPYYEALAGTVATGGFSFEESLVPVGGFGRVLGPGLFTDFSFVWNGIGYNETTADAITLGFGGYPYLGTRKAGELTSFVFGNHCHDAMAPDTCLVLNGTNDWRAGMHVSVDPDTHAVTLESSFFYSLPGVLGSFAIFPRSSSPNGPIQITQVPEPSSYVLLIAGLAGVVGVAKLRRASAST